MRTLVRRACAGLGAVVLSASALAAQGGMSPGVERQWSFGITGGATFPSGDFGERAGTGYNVGALIEYKPAPGPLSIRIEGDYQAFGESDDLSAAGTSADFSIIRGTGAFVWRFPMEATTVRPYLTGGAGVYWLDAESEGPILEVSGSETKFGLNGGFGIELPLTGLTTFIEGSFHTVFTDGDNTYFWPVRVGIRF
jgi:hypothetical protein